MTESTITSTSSTPPRLGPVTLQRRMSWFGASALGLDVGVRKEVDPDFLVRLMTGDLGHQAWLRRSLGEDFENFENALRGRATRQASIRAIAEKANLSVQQVRDLLSMDVVGAADLAERWHHLFPSLPAVMAVIAALPSQLHEHLVAHEVTCKNCGAHLLVDLDPWWANQPERLRLGQDEYRFVEQLLLLAVYASGVGALLLGRPVIEISRLLLAPKHPIGNWMTLVMGLFDAGDLAELADVVSLERGRLKKFSSGAAFIAASSRERILAVEEFGASDGPPRKLRAHLVAASFLAFVVDFTEAALSQQVDRKSVQEVVAARTYQIQKNVALAIANMLNKDNLPGSPALAP